MTMIKINKSWIPAFVIMMGAISYLWYYFLKANLPLYTQTGQVIYVCGMILFMFESLWIGFIIAKLFTKKELK